jgi:hypothetical protein
LSIQNFKIGHFQEEGHLTDEKIDAQWRLEDESSEIE